jgi:hypothetical protein
MLLFLRALFLLGFAAGLLRPQGVIQLKTRQEEPLADLQEHLAGPLKRRLPGRSHYLLEFANPPGIPEWESLKERGVEVLGRVPENAVMVSAPDEVGFDGLGLRFAGRLRERDKLSPLLEQSAETGELSMLPTYVVEFHSDTDMAENRLLLEESGVRVIENPDLLPWQLLGEGTYQQMLPVADWDEVAYVFPASQELIEGVPVAGCPGGVLGESLVGQYVKVGQGWTKGANGEAQLRVFIHNFPSGLTMENTRAEIERALSQWGAAAKVNFLAADSGGEATIEILFASRNHGDAYPFDGTGKVLAHTFYPAPPNAETLAGDMHLDADESWNIGKSVDVFSVVLHELGHALGLGHSDSPSAVMYPYYRQLTKLASDDIKGIRDLYGARDTESGSAPTTPSTPADPATPTTPSTPTDPTTPAAPTTPSNPTTPSSPATPSTPSAPSAPSTPKADTVAPSLAISFPATTIVSTTAQSITMRGSASDASGIVSVKWTNGSRQSAASGTSFWTASVPLLVGNNTIIVRAYDAAGNSSWRSVTVVRR